MNAQQDNPTAKMETYKHLYTQICTKENICKAYRKARLGKRKKFYVRKFESDVDANIEQLHQQLRDESWTPLPYKQFTAYEPKERLIRAPQFPDRIVHHALIRMLEPIYNKILIYDTYASRKNKGTHATVDRLTRFLRRDNDNVFVFHGDVRKFFDNIDHETLIKILRKKIVDERVITLIKKILTNQGISLGVTLGNYTSQWFANIYLSELDYFAKHNLKVKHYIRYMDDFLLLSDSKPELHRWKHQIEKFLNERLKLELHPVKRQIFPTNIGIDFVGYTIWKDHKKLRRRDVNRFISRLNEFDKLPVMTPFAEASLMSWKGYSIHADAFGLTKQLHKSHPAMQVSTLDRYIN
ncbi:reverse transcriptase [ANMV-1 virus]|nr:reverse transcriptase [ANMV-1 virus]